MKGPTMPSAPADQIAEVNRRLDTLLAETDGADDVTFLGAQFDAGLAWVHFPVGHGGLAAAPKVQEVIDQRLREAGRLGDWRRNPMGIGMVGPTIASHGREDQRTAYLRRIFTAEHIWCQLFSEPSAGSDVATLATRAVRDGDQWVVNGQKVWTSNGAIAHHGMLLARTDPDVPKHRGITSFLIDMHDPGVEVRPLRQMSGQSHFSEVYFTDARILDSTRIGDVGRGWDVAVATLMNERVSIGGQVEPRGSGTIALAVDAYRQRTDRSSAERDRLMQLWTAAEVLRLGNVRAQQRREHGTPGPEGSVLKLGGALLMQKITAFAVDLLGAEGMLFDQYDAVSRSTDPVEQFLSSQASTIAGGTSEIMRNILGERVLGLPSEPRNDRDVPWSEIPRGA
jgi:alkylation response protein AidB-like acyl-CoA dehydrogenase